MTTIRTKYKLYEYREGEYEALMEERKDQEGDDIYFACVSCESEAGILYIMSDSPEKSDHEALVNDADNGQRCPNCITSLLAEWDYTIQYG